MATVRAMARHRLARMSMIGVPRQVIVQRRQRGAAAALHAYAPAANLAGFFAFQAGPQGAAVMAAA